MRLCYSCGKTPPNGPKLCAKCKSTSYCGQLCQKSHWKTHKKVCDIQAANQSTSGQPIPADASAKCSCSSLTIVKPFTNLQAGSWLHGHSKQVTYQLLIDAYLLWISDMYLFEGALVVDPTRITTMLGPSFEKWLTTNVYKKKPLLLPIWWTEADNKACVAFGSQKSIENFHNLVTMADKGDIIDHYGNSLMPMQMRMFVERIRGCGIGGADSTSMINMQVSMESGEGPDYVSTFGFTHAPSSFGE